MAAGSNHGRAFLHGAVVQRVGSKSVPVHEVGAVGCVGDVDGDGHALAEAQQRTGYLAVVGDGFDGDAGRYLEDARLDGEGVVGCGEGDFVSRFLCSSLRGGIKQARRSWNEGTEQRLGRHDTGGSQERSTVHKPSHILSIKER